MVFKKTVVYCRVSTLQQKTDSQRGAIQKWLKEHDITNVEWVEDKVSGKTPDRKEYQKLLGQIKGGWVERVICYDLSRIGRKLSENISFANACFDRKTELVSVRDGLLLDTPEGRLKFHIVCAMNEYQRELIVEKTREGIAARKARGLKHGGTAKGWTADKVAKKLDGLYVLIDAGKSLRYIREMTGLNYRTIRKYADARGQVIKNRKTLNTEVYGHSDAKPQ